MKGLNKMKGFKKLKLALMPAVIVVVLVAIYIFNSYQKNDTAIVYADDGTYIEASGMVESNSISLSSEVTGTVVESLVKEGDRIKKDAAIAIIENTSLKNQYDQALTNLQISKENIEVLENNINSLSLQNSDATLQAKYAYLTTKAENQKVLDGASKEEINQLEEAVNQAKTNLDYIKSNLEKNKELLENQAITQSTYDETLKNYNVSKSQYNAAVSQLNFIKSNPTESVVKVAKDKMLQAKAGYELSKSNGNTQLTQLKGQLKIAKAKLKQSKNMTDQTKKELDKLIIKSPTDGIVNALFINEGEFVSMGKLVAEIYNPDNTEIKAYVSEANIGLIKVGQDTNIMIDSSNDKIYKGKVTKISNSAEFTPKNIQTKEERVNTVYEITIKSLDTKGTIKPGMPVDIYLKID